METDPITLMMWLFLAAGLLLLALGGISLVLDAHREAKRDNAIAHQEWGD